MSVTMFVQKFGIMKVFIFFKEINNYIQRGCIKMEKSDIYTLIMLQKFLNYVLLNFIFNIKQHKCFLKSAY